LVHCTCLLLTQSGHWVSLNNPRSNRYDALSPIRFSLVSEKNWSLSLNDINCQLFTNFENSPRSATL
ncbi:MAG: hypothetical protein WCF75_01175, partial [Pseudolabrys sp.]